MPDFSLPSLRNILKRAIEPAHVYSNQIDRALNLAYKAHDGQFREHRSPTAPKIPYIAHPVGVATTAVSLLPYADLTDSFDDLISACLTHDVLEDAEVSLSELERATSARAANIVLALTKPPVTTTKSRAERNAAFLQQIISAGPTPAFIKVCDAIHNLSRPGSMPFDLLGKTTIKAVEDYLKLANNARFQPVVREALEDRIREAKFAASNHADARRSSEFPSFDAAVGYSLEKSKSKVLEEHDIVAIIQTVTKAQHCFIGPIEDYLHLYLDELRADRGEQSRKNIAGQLNVGTLDLTSRLFDREKMRKQGLSQVVSCPFDMSNDLAEHQFLFVAVSKTCMPSWLSFATLRGITSILSERLRGREARQLSQIAEEISHLGLSLDPGLARVAKLTHENLISLKARVEAAEFVYRNLLRSAQRLAADTGIEAYVDRVEGRVKSVNSIVKKMQARKLSDVNEMDDLVGVRMIFMSNGVRERFSDALLKEMRSESTDFARMVPVITSSVDLEKVESSIGYKAVHIRFKVKAPTVLFETVPCEVQLRTIFEDAWARSLADSCV